jgi:uncharacterized protein YegJ (DUF2314 family)
MRLIATLVLLAAAFLSSPGVIGSANAQGTFRDVGGEQMGVIPKGDPLMAEAKRKARATLPEFLDLVRTPRASITGMGVKIGIPYGRNDVEYFWVMDLSISDGKITGRLSNAPRFVKNVRAGEMLRFTEGDVVDWLYRQDGKMKGNYTSRALIAREPKDQRDALVKRFGVDCEF